MVTKFRGIGYRVRKYKTSVSVSVGEYPIRDGILFSLFSYQNWSMNSLSDQLYHRNHLAKPERTFDKENEINYPFFERIQISVYSAAER